MMAMTTMMTMNCQTQQRTVSQYCRFLLAIVLVTSASNRNSFSTRSRNATRNSHCNRKDDTVAQPEAPPCWREIVTERVTVVAQP